MNINKIKSEISWKLTLMAYSSVFVFGLFVVTLFVDFGISYVAIKTELFNYRYISIEATSTYFDYITSRMLKIYSSMFILVPLYFLIKKELKKIVNSKRFRKSI